jgi:predicted DNA-binding transcriptional regulator YafY
MWDTIGNMANTSSRTLRLLSLLQNHRFWPGAELAQRLGVSSRTLRRDVDRLRELGYPVTAHPGVDGGYQLAPGAALPPLVLDDEEAVALAVGLRLATQGTVAAPGGTTTDSPSRGSTKQGAASRGSTARVGAVPDGGAPGSDHNTIAEAAARALAKVTQVMPSRLRRRAEAVAAMTESATWERPGQATPVDPDILASTALACRDTERLRFAYTAANGERTERHVEPHRLVALDRRWYLVAYDLTRNDWRSFRLDRVQDVPRPAGARFRPRVLPAEDAAEFVRGSIAAVPGGGEVKALMEAPAEVVRQRIGRWAAIEEDGPNRCRVTMTPPDDSDWPVIALGVAGADFQLIGQPELRARLSDWSARFARAATETA